MQSHKMSPILRGIPTIYSGKSGQRLHRGEEQHVADGGRIGQQHHEAVQAEAEAARGGQAVFQREDEILIHRGVGALRALGGLTAPAAQSAEAAEAPAAEADSQTVGGLQGMLGL